MCECMCIRMCVCARVYTIIIIIVSGEMHPFGAAIQPFPKHAPSFELMKY